MGGKMGVSCFDCVKYRGEAIQMWYLISNSKISHLNNSAPMRQKWKDYSGKMEKVKMKCIGYYRMDRWI